MKTRHPVHPSANLRPSACIGEILSRIGRGEPPCVDGELSTKDVGELWKHCKEGRNRFAAEIAKELHAGHTHSARGKFNKMLRNTSVRLSALMEANVKHALAERRRARHEGRDDSSIAPIPFGKLCALLPDIDIFGRVASGRLALILKNDGEYRPVTSFGLADRACGILLKHALFPFARAHPQLACHEGQCMLAGGAHTACENLTTALEGAPPEAVFIQIDVKRFYEHVSIEHLSQFTGLSQTIIRGFISAGDLVRRGDFRHWVKNRSLFSLPIEVVMPTAEPSGAGGVSKHADRCIAPGSAVSPIVGEMVMGHVLRDVCARISGALYLGSYSDNIGILAPDKAAASAFVVAVRDVLQGHPAGPFQVSKWSARRVTRGFSYLGYHFDRTPKGIVAYPRTAALERFFYHHTQGIQAAMVGNFVVEFPRLRGEIQQFPSAFPLWAGRGKWRERQEAELFSVLVAYCRENGLSPFTLVKGADWPKVSAAERALDTPNAPVRLFAQPERCPHWPFRIPVPERERDQTLATLRATCPSQCSRLKIEVGCSGWLSPS